MLAKRFRKTPLAWLQVTREKMRLAVAIAGIAFADMLMFVQFGFQDALFDASVRPHSTFKADLVVVNSQFETFFSTKSFSRERLYQVRGFEGVESVSAIYAATAQWKNPTTRVDRPILIFGTDPANPGFNLPEVDENIEELKKLNRVLFDRAGRPEYGIVPIFEATGTAKTEVNDRLVEVVGMFALGASFTADGTAIASDSTFLHMFPNRSVDRIEVGLVEIGDDADLERVQLGIQEQLPDDVRVLTVEEFADLERSYWANGTGIGFIFSLGAGVGFIVGIVIVYQILYTDVSEHLPEYATLKAMGYTDGYLIEVLIQESLLLAVLGFIPGFAIASGLYSIAKSATLLPIAMTTSRALLVWSLTIVMCSVSGIVAMRKLQTADPADIFG
ncbi:MAG: ABC transporter permease DevC [Cyanobacteriota bacterium]|nr:ABC transporter permease DevC [Cyanobacteriota bacterium]